MVCWLLRPYGPTSPMNATRHGRWAAAGAAGIGRDISRPCGPTSPMNATRHEGRHCCGCGAPADRAQAADAYG